MVGASCFPTSPLIRNRAFVPFPTIKSCSILMPCQIAHLFVGRNIGAVLEAFCGGTQSVIYLVSILSNDTILSFECVLSDTILSVNHDSAGSILQYTVHIGDEPDVQT